MMMVKAFNDFIVGVGNFGKRNPNLFSRWVMNEIKEVIETASDLLYIQDFSKLEVI